MGLLSRCTPSELADVRQAAEGDLLVFTALMFRARTGMTFRVNRHHERIADALMRCYAREIPNLLINTPPGSSKTELAVVHFVPWCLARNPWCRFLHLSYSDDLASLNSSTAKEIMETEEFQRLWPTSFRRDTKAKKRWSVERDGRSAGGVYATSTGGQVTGFRAGYMTPGFSGAVLIDDPIKPEDAWSKSRRETANRRLTNTVRSRRATDDTPVILIMQRVHEDDPSALALNGKLGMAFEHVSIEAVVDEGGPAERSYWPDKEALESLLALKDSDPYTFSSQYQQQPVPPGGAMIKTDWIQCFDTPPAGLIKAGIFVDMAQKTNEWNDYTVFVYAATDGRNVYVLDVLRKILQAPDLIVEAKAFWDRHRPGRIRNPIPFAGFFVEDKSSGTGLIQHLKRETAIPVIAVQRSRDKVQRVNDVLPYIRAGQLWIPADAPWTSPYLGELAAFSPAMTQTHDDQVDPTVDALNELLSPGGNALPGADWS